MQHSSGPPPKPRHGNKPNSRRSNVPLLKLPHGSRRRLHNRHNSVRLLKRPHGSRRRPRNKRSSVQRQKLPTGNKPNNERQQRPRRGS
jgi:hypothetical protein